MFCLEQRQYLLLEMIFKKRDFEIDKVVEDIFHLEFSQPSEDKRNIVSNNNYIVVVNCIVKVDIFK